MCLHLLTKLLDKFNLIQAAYRFYKFLLQKPDAGFAAMAGRLTHVGSDHGGLVFRDGDRGLVLVHASRVLVDLLLTLAEF